MLTYQKLVKLIIGVTIFALAFSGCISRRKTDVQEAIPKAGESLTVTATLEKNAIPEASATPEPTVTPMVPTPTIEIVGTAELVAVLTAAGAQVEIGGKIEQPMLEQYEVNGQIIKVNGVEVQVFEFTNELTRKLVSSQISSDGSSIATYTFSWADQPNFWAEARLIVLYVGTDTAMIDMISGVMGEPITSHE